jgi:hypothetical protein
MEWPRRTFTIRDALQRDLIALGVFASRADLARKIARYIKGHNKNAKLFSGLAETLTAVSVEGSSRWKVATLTRVPQFVLH